MIISIETDIIDAAMSSDDIALDVLHQCAIAIIRGKHIVEIKIQDVNKLLTLKDKFSRQELSAFGFVSKKYVQLGYLNSLISVKCIVTFARNTEKADDIIYLNPIDNRRFELFEETHLLVENIEDAFFFKYLTDYFQRKKKTMNCSVCSYKLMGGGDTTAKVLEYENNLQEHFVLAIADSDKHYPGDPHLGETASKIESCISSNPFNCSLYHMTMVCEIENLIPFECIRKINNFKNHILILDKKGFDYSFFDMKDGIHYSYLYSDEGFNHWAAQISHLVDSQILKIIDSDRHKMSKERFSNLHKDKRLFCAFGTQILSQSLNQMKSEHRVFSDADLSPNQQYEWENIGKIITSWCCCYSKQRV